MWIGRRADAWERTALLCSMLSADNVPAAMFSPFERHKLQAQRGGRIEIPYDAEEAKKWFAPFNRQ